MQAVIVTKFLQCAFTVWVTTILMCIVVVGIFRSQPMENLLPEVQLCQDVGCFAGIVPKQTGWDEAVVQIQNSPSLIYQQDRRVGYLSSSKDKFSLTQNPSKRVVNEVDLVLRSQNLTLGWLIAQYGFPCSIGSLSPKIVSVKYPGLAFFVSLELDAGNARLNSPIKHVIVHGLQRNSCAATDFDVAWRGFTKISERP